MKITHSPIWLTCRDYSQAFSVTLRQALLKMAGLAFMAFLFFQAGSEKAFAALPLLPGVPTVVPVSNPITNAASQPQQNINADSRIAPSIASQLLNLMAQGSVGIQGPGSS